MRHSKLLTGLIALLMTIGCASGPEKPIRVEEMKDSSLGLVYGQIYVAREDWHNFGDIMLQRVGKVYAGRLGEKVKVTRDGKYVAANLKPGKYMLAGFTIGTSRHFMGRDALNYTVEVKPGGIYYIGTFNYIYHESGNIVRPGSFHLERDGSKAAHTRVLNWLEEATRETQWHGQVRKRLSGTHPQ